MQILLACLASRPRTLVYVARAFKPTICLASNSLLDSDLMLLDITENSNKIQLANVYNEKP